MNPESKLRRRVFMKALGLGIAAPLAMKFANMAGAAPGGRPCRLICYYFPNGVPNEHMDMQPYMTKTGDFADFGQSATNGLSRVDVNSAYTFDTRSGFNFLSPLEPYRAMTHVIRGLYQSGEFGTHDSIANILTGDAAGPSIDRAVAAELGLRAMTLGAVPREWDQLDASNGVLVRDTADWIAADGDVVAKYDELFGGAPVDAGAPDESQFRAAAIDLTISEVTALRAQVSGLTQADDKLAAHLAALENAKSQSTLGGGQGCAQNPAIPHIDSLRGLDAGAQPWEQKYWQKGENFERIAEAQAELAAYSVLCGHAEVVTLQNMWASGDLPMPQTLPHRANDGYHLQVTHQNYNGNLADEKRMDFAMCAQFFVKQMARICEILDQPDPLDAEHTALENTIIYGFSEIGDGQNHGKKLQILQTGADMFEYYPAIIVGGGGGALTPGALVTVDNRPIADLLLTLGKAMGSTMTSFGTYGASPLTEILA